MTNQGTTELPTSTGGIGVYVGGGESGGYDGGGDHGPGDRGRPFERKCHIADLGEMASNTHRDLHLYALSFIEPGPRGPLLVDKFWLSGPGSLYKRERPTQIDWVLSRTGDTEYFFGTFCPGSNLKYITPHQFNAFPRIFGLPVRIIKRLDESVNFGSIHAILKTLFEGQVSHPMTPDLIPREYAGWEIPKLQDLKKLFYP